MTKNYVVEMKVKNNLVYSRMKEHGFKTNADLARAASIAEVIVGKIVDLKMPLYNKLGRVRNYYERLAVLFRCLPEELVPEDHWYDGLRSNVAHVEMDKGDIQGFIEQKSPEQLVLDHQISEEIASALDMLSPRMKLIIEHRYELNGKDFKSLEEIADMYGITRERVRQLENKALEKLALPSYMPNVSSMARRNELEGIGYDKEQAKTQRRWTKYGTKSS